MGSTSSVELSTTIRRGYVPAGAIPLVAAFLMSLLSAIGHFTVGWAFALALAAVTVWSARKRVWRVVASRDGLRVGEEWIGRPRLRNAFVFQERKTSFVRIEVGLSRLDVMVPSARVGRQLVGALGLDGSASTTETSLIRQPQLPSFVSGIVVLFLGPAIYFVGWYLRDHQMLFFLGVLCLIVCTTVTLLLLRTAKVSIGADGVALENRARKGTFIPYEAITGVRREAAVVVIQLASGQTPLRLATTIGRPVHDDIERASAIVARIERARSALHERSDPLAALDRASRSPSEWIAALRRLCQVGTYRGQHVPRDALWRVLEDAQARSVDRVAAAIALKEGASVDHRERLSAAAERCANPVVRQGIRTVLDTQDDGSLVEVLAAASST